jgi:hypothetical protein
MLIATLLAGSHSHNTSHRLSHSTHSSGASILLCFWTLLWSSWTTLCRDATGGSTSGNQRAIEVFRCVCVPEVARYDDIKQCSPRLSVVPLLDEGVNNSSSPIYAWALCNGKLNAQNPIPNSPSNLDPAPFRRIHDSELALDDF